MAPSSWQAARRRLALLLALAAGVYILLFFLVAALRDTFPLQLEWLECGVLDATARAYRHRPIYTAPTHTFVPYIYTPLYYYCAATLAKVTGLSFVTLRAFSAGCTALCLLFIFDLSRRMAECSRYAGLLAAGLFAALYAAADSWYDLARVDMLFLALTLAGIVFAYRGRPILAGLLFAVAFQAKQSALLIGFFVLLHEYRRIPRLLTGLASLALFTGVSVLLFNHLSGGWYLYYTEFLPSHQGISLHGAAAFFGRDLLRYLLPALVLLGIAAVDFRKRAEAAPRRTAFVVFTSLGVFLSSLAARVHQGGSVNVVLPLYAWIAVLFGACLAWAAREVDAAGPRALRRRVLFLLGGVAQFALLIYAPGRLIPSHTAQAEANTVLDRLALFPGSVYVFDNSADLLERGRPAFANTDAIYDLLRADSGPAAQALRADMEAAFRRGEFGAVVADRPDVAGMPYPGAPADLMSGFCPPVRLAAASAAIATVEPPPVAPRFLFRSRRSVGGATCPDPAEEWRPDYPAPAGQ
jgi:hypothetical protein